MSQNAALSAHAAPVMMTTEEAASLIGVTRRFLEKDRHTARQNGTSPAIPYSEMGRRTVRYNRADVLAFLDATRVE